MKRPRGVIPLIDATLLGEMTAKMMDTLEAEPVVDEDGDEVEGIEMVAVGIVVVCSNGEFSFTRTFCSDLRTYQQIGLFTAALECSKE